jgi:hypothetical protein
MYGSMSLSYQQCRGSINRRITVQVTQGIYAKPIQKITKEK